ncbi:hypothetical protein E0Z10_g10852 [Xylaria hypoxylon]|uniref:Uncharacterized protein n=1 Tax=Xylaria hypoxylon TaxID=37992 RepID=A0A4Z0YAW1_9PEZI|nr:hypothetical protein E0Z10_g10852 [Xylaria hypoxylon]
MARKSHHRSRSSIDRVLDLLAGLDENQMEALLREAESTVAGNIPVSKGIDFFGRPGLIPTSTHPPPPPPAPRRKFLTSLSPRKQTELRRRQSKRASTHQDASAGNTGNSESIQSSKKTPRSYKRISRPVFSLPAPAATADLTELLAAYLLDTPAALPSSPTPSFTLSSPITPRSQFSPNAQSGRERPEPDLLEPSPPRASRTLDIFGRPVKGLTRKISGIFEVLDDAGSIAQSIGQRR